VQSDLNDPERWPSEPADRLRPKDVLLRGFRRPESVTFTDDEQQALTAYIADRWPLWSAEGPLQGLM
jgi:hypothetical protein